MDIIQTIKNYISGGNPIGKVVGDKVVLKDIVLGELDANSKFLKSFRGHKGYQQPLGLMFYTLLQLSGISVYNNLPETSKSEIREVMGLPDDESTKRAYAYHYAVYAVYGRG